MFLLDFSFLKGFILILTGTGSKFTTIHCEFERKSREVVNMEDISSTKNYVNKNTIMI